LRRTRSNKLRSEPPRAVAVLNPKRADCLYPDKWLAGVGVAFKLVQALLTDHPQRDALIPHFLKIAALGTLADVVPLVGENRVIARHGLRSLSAPKHSVGLQALLEECGLLGKQLDSFHVSFVMAPRLNAAGRMDSADLAIELLLLKGRDAETQARATELAKRLTAENTRRQEEEARILAEARRMVEKDPEIGGQNLLIVASEDWHRGVIGIVASKLVDAFHKPTLVLSIQDGVAQGSGRSIRAFDLLAGLEACADLFVRFGGHRQAAGVTIDADRIPELRRRLTAWANERLSPEDLMPRLRIDSWLGLREITGEVMAGLERLGPFGASNPKPVFRASPVELMRPPKRLKERHLALLVRQDGRAFRAMAWRAAEREDYLNANRHELELAYTLGQNEFRGERTTELTVADVRVPVVETVESSG
jgi:single-stranded-DNA-specific exonuclease